MRKRSKPRRNRRHDNAAQILHSAMEQAHQALFHLWVVEQALPEAAAVPSATLRKMGGGMVGLLGALHQGGYYDLVDDYEEYTKDATERRLFVEALEALAQDARERLLAKKPK